MLRSNPLYVVLLAAGAASAAQYALVDKFDHTNFFSSFDFFDGDDPTHGFVQYASARNANAHGLAGYGPNNMVYLGVDYKTANPAAGRASVRVSSRKTYTQGLFLADIEHMPVGCGVWPAFWSFGPGWPSGGEIDILEGVNTATTNAVTLHTSSGCTMSGAGSVATTQFAATGPDCGQGGGFNGCSQHAASQATYGDGFNAAKGGVYAMEWTSSAISVWFLPRGSAAASALAGTTTTTGGSNGTYATASGGGGRRGGSPDTATFGPPLARFSGPGCNIDQHFQNHQLVFNTALCGDWAGKVWSQDATCSKLASTCDQYVAANPEAFADAYWLINSVKVYQQAGAATKRSAKARRFVA